MSVSSHQHSRGFRATLPIIGWVLSWLYPLFLLPPAITTATQYSDDAWAVSLFIGVPLAIVALVLIYSGGAQHSRLLAVPHLFTAVLAFTILLPYFWPATVHGQHLAAVKLGSVVTASELQTPFWHRAFVPMHFFCLAAFAWAALHSRPRLNNEFEANAA